MAWKKDAPYRDLAEPLWEQLVNNLKEGAESAIGTGVAELEPSKLKLPTWEIAASQEKVETPTGFSGFEVAKVNAKEWRTRGTWKASAEIPINTEFMTLKVAPAAERKGQLSLIIGAAEKLTVVAFNVKATAKIENLTAIPNGGFIYFNGGWFEA